MIWGGNNSGYERRPKPAPRRAATQVGHRSAPTIATVLGAITHTFAAVAAVFRTIATILGTITDIFAAITHVFTRIATILDAIATTTVMRIITDILAHITAVLGTVAGIFAPVVTILGTVAVVLTVVAAIFGTVAHLFAAITVDDRAVAIGGGRRQGEGQGQQGGG